VCVTSQLPYSDEKVANRFGWEIAHEDVSRRPPISLYTIVARTHMYTYAAHVWDLSIMCKGNFLSMPHDSQLLHCLC
jgi:hypothetical protein